MKHFSAPRRSKTALGILLAIFSVLAILLFLLRPAKYAESVRTGISLWAVSVLPATFPMLFLTALLSGQTFFHRAARFLAPASEKVYRISGAGALAAILSALSGYPVGARTVADLARADLISREELFGVSILATTSGPAFIVGAVGAGMLNAPTLGWLILLSHMIGVYAVALLFRPKKRPPRIVPPPAEAPSLSDLLTNSVLSVLTVGGAIALFFAFGEMLSDLLTALSVPEGVQIALRGLLEMTTGCALLKDPTPLTLAAQTFFITFGGLCVLVQQLAFLAPVGVPAGKLIAVKFLQGTLAALICALLSPLWGVYI